MFYLVLKIVEQGQFLQSRSAAIQIVGQGSGFVEPLDVLQHGDHCLFPIEQVPQFVRLDVEQRGGCGEEADKDSDPGDDHHDDEHEDDEDTGLTSVEAGLSAV